MTKSLKKDFRREIKKSISRFISIMLIVALGVAFYSGVRSTMPAMHMTADAAYDKEYAYLDMDKLPEEIKIWDAVYTNWTWNAKKDCREIESVEPIKKGTYFYSYNNADLCLVSDNDRNARFVVLNGL